MMITPKTPLCELIRFNVSSTTVISPMVCKVEKATDLRDLQELQCWSCKVEICLQLLILSPQALYCSADTGTDCLHRTALRRRSCLHNVPLPCNCCMAWRHCLQLTWWEVYVVPTEDDHSQDSSVRAAAALRGLT